MLQLVALGLVGAVGWYAYNAFRRESGRVNQQMREEESKSARVTELEAGEDGVYRPKGEENGDSNRSS